MRDRRAIPTDEHETSFYGKYALIGLGLCGGSHNSQSFIRTKVNDLLKDKLTEGDHQYMRRKRDGHEVPTSESYPGTKWERWQGRFNVALYNLVNDGLVTRKDNVFTLTDQGIVQLATLARSGV
jgi:hypothetical protein